MNRADARAAEHGHSGFGNHRHVNGDAIALLDAERFQYISKFANVGVKLRVGDALHVFFRFALPNNRGLVAARFEMPIEAVDGDVELAVLKKGVFNFSRVGVPSVFAGDGRLYEPVERVCLFEPEFFRLADGARRQRVILRGVDERAVDGFGGWRKRASGLLQGFGGNGLVAHAVGKFGWRISENKTAVSIAVMSDKRKLPK